MRIHHFYPRTLNIGDHFVQKGITEMIRRITPEATFELFDVNRRGQDKTDYGLTQRAVERANQEADLIIIGGSNLYEGGFRWPWGVRLEPNALKKLRVPLFLLGVGTGSNFDSPLHKPSARAKAEIRLLNDYATFSGARDTLTLEWLHDLGVTKAKLLGDPASFIFNYSSQPRNHGGHILITIPPRRMWASKRQFWKVRQSGRPIFEALVSLTRTLLEKGEQVVVACNDPFDLPVAQKLFGTWLPVPVVCPATPEEYFRLLSESQLVISGRLHTAVVALSFGIPFLLLDVDGRTHGFLETYELEPWSVKPSRSGVGGRLHKQTEFLLSENGSPAWRSRIEKRDQIYSVAMALLSSALKAIS
jgi:polysaccharide pyruvyl transferase WcaK-like protein